MNSSPSNPSRRQFIARSCLACGLFSFAGKLRLLGEEDSMDLPDPKKLNYCGYVCPGNCPLKQATINNDADKKKEAYVMWELKERYGLEFDPEAIFCHGCKVEEDLLGPAVIHCPVRACVRDKGLDCCIECEALSSCDKELWGKYPDFYQMVLKMQQRYQQG